MAAAPSSSECAVCSEAYNGTDHDPVVLHCGHTFCRSCMIQLAQTRPGTSVLECPTCRQETRIPVPFDPSCLSRNFELAALVVAAPGQPPLVPPSLLAQAQQRLEAQRRTMERASSQTPESFDATIEAAVQQMRQAVDESGNRIRQQVRENASKIAESLHLLEQNQQALQHELEELSRQQTSPEARILVVETVKRIQALLGVPQIDVPAISLDLTVPAEFTQALSTLGRVETVGEEKPADAPKALNFPQPGLEPPLRLFARVPRGQPTTRAHILQWYRRLIAMDDGTCPALQLAALLELPDFAKDPEALRATLQAARAVAERDAKRKGRVAELAAPAVCRLLPACPPAILGDVLAVVVSLSQAPNGPTMFNPCFAPIHKLLAANPNHPLATESLRICAQLAPSLNSSQFGECTTLCASMASNARFLANNEALAQLLGLIKQLAQRDDYSSMAKLYSALVSNIPFMANPDAVAQLLTAMLRTAQLKYNSIWSYTSSAWRADRRSELVAMFRDHLYPALELLDDGRAMDNAPLVEMLLTFLQELWKYDDTLKQCLQEAAYPERLASLQGHPVLQAHPELGKLP
ncbi:hypothetical protein PAPYR_8103 [Paratrimastix pyriformis]|uniref:RING-type domain-containing protein n=1 Tax=Paratrimastix pyriformis TaxID=342808 RepID=A0ABQ8UDV8_9EUKA|nr:hypothetical protein PAPYR_8103 [Paratrimastix pyriformis]